LEFVQHEAASLLALSKGEESVDKPWLSAWKSIPVGLTAYQGNRRLQHP
jgi:hypothetical protein